MGVPPWKFKHVHSAALEHLWPRKPAPPSNIPTDVLRGHAARKFCLAESLVLPFLSSISCGCLHSTPKKKATTTQHIEASVALEVAGLHMSADR